ncbi:AraC family transcriptional regulator [Paraburkholderia sp. C35]|uniref:helix-turn-helix domain-containing protein n=1 Tax=Paraburkholderia sp. C35 TaxID=2126993 RepID=UPI000D68FB5C|nr:AraC family transcriptional regulator [Paraburkholderia sp. C35]
MSADASQHPASGIEQFRIVSCASGIDYCVSKSGPYLLDLVNTADVVCLLLGDIVSDTRYDDARPSAHIFRGETSAFHPKGSRMRIDAREVRQRFIAFRYSDDFQQNVSEHDSQLLRRNGSIDNIGAQAIAHLARYARQKLSGAQLLDPWEAQSLATLAYIETTRQLERPDKARKIAMSNAEFARMEAFILSNIAESLTVAEIAQAVGLPVRLIADSVKNRTGYSLYHMVVEKRVELASQMLRESDTPISEIAFACGFSSQQHMTGIFSERRGITPLRMRKSDQGNLE